MAATLSLVVALLLGVVGLSLLFADLGPGETLAGRTAGAALFFVVAGLVVGWLARRAWWLAAAAAWGSALLGLVGLVGLVTGSVPVSPRSALEALAALFGPTVLALAGGYAGSRLRTR